MKIPEEEKEGNKILEDVGRVEINTSKWWWKVVAGRENGNGDKQILVWLL